MKILIIVWLLFSSNYIFAQQFYSELSLKNSDIEIANIPLKHNDDSVSKFVVDDYPVTDSMFKLSNDVLIAAGLRNIDRVWYSNDSLNETLIFEIYTDYFRMNTFHFYNNDIPSGLLKRLVLYDESGNYATEENKANGILSLQKLATLISPKYFITNKGFVLGDTKEKAIDIYGKPDTISILDGVEKLQWKFIGDIYYYDHKRDLKGKPFAEHSFGHTITMFFRDDKLIGLILENEIP